jgi:hypothetical protein
MNLLEYQARHLPNMRAMHAWDIYGESGWCQEEFKRIALARCATELARQVLANEFARYNKAGKRIAAGELGD